jgi:hypothetical protein
VKSLWIDRQAASGMEHPEEYDAANYEFIPARVSDNPIYAQDENYLKTLRALPLHLRRAFLDGDWDVFAGQYFDRFDFARHVRRAEEIDWKPWWRRRISVDWGFEHPAAVYWHAAVPGIEAGEGEANRIVTHREYVTHRTPPRELARDIIARGIGTSTKPRGDPSGLYNSVQDEGVGEGAEREKVEAVYLSPDAFARRTDEASIAEQMGDVFTAAGLPRPVPADDDRVGGWMLMYQMLDAGEWVLTENCIELIRALPNLVRDPARIEDIEKMDGDDPADAARYGLKSRYAVHRGGERRMPLADRLAARALSADPTIRAIQARKAQIEETRGVGPVSFLHRRR